MDHRTTAPREALALHESIASLVETASGPVQDDGTVTLHIIRPTVGRGKGSHLYEANMLEANAHKFAGWRMFINHLSPEARKAAGGLPRDVRDLGGRITESWWDPNVPASGRYQAGAVVGRAKPTKFIRELIENDPEIVEASISATATGVKPGQRDGKKVWIVEGIADHGSVDWVTEAGAGGRVVSLMESAFQSDPDGSLGALSDDEFMQHLRADRPHLAEALVKPTSVTGSSTEEDNMQITPEVLTEALQSDEGKTAIEEAVNAVLGSLPTLVESAIADERDLIRAEARADADRQIQLRDMRDTAHGLIEAASARWPQSLRDEAKAKFALVEGSPTSALDVLDEIDDNGNVSKSATESLREAVQTVVERNTTLLASMRPTRVVGQGGAKLEESDGSRDKEKPAEGTLYGAVLQEAGIDANGAWG